MVTTELFRADYGRFGVPAAGIKGRGHESRTSHLSSNEWRAVRDLLLRSNQEPYLRLVDILSDTLTLACILCTRFKRVGGCYSPRWHHMA